jgi:predicted lipid-binding transport protein (Tim44 family)
MSLLRFFLAALALTAGFSLVAADVVEARAGGGRSFGSRGIKTYTAPPATKTAPSSAPIQRSMTDKPGPAGAAASRPGAAAAQQSRFGGWRGLMMGGLFAAALGSIFGFGALVGVLGFLLQFALIGGAIYFVVNFLRSRNQTVAAPAAGGRNASRDTPNRSPYTFSGREPAAALPLVIGQEDLDSFERLLREIQTAYGSEDTEELGARTTPEMFSYFSQELYD